MANRRANTMKPNFAGNRNVAPSRQLNPWISGNESSRFTSNVADPQTQLALASNLLNNLLNPGQPSVSICQINLKYFVSVIKKSVQIFKLFNSKLQYNCLFYKC